MRCNGIITGTGLFRSRPREDHPACTQEPENKYSSLGIDHRRKHANGNSDMIKKVES
jgi:hypothetical protein